MSVPTYTLDARTPDGRYATGTGLSAQEVQNAYANAPRLGVEILAVFRDDVPAPLTEAELVAAFGGAS